MIKGVLVSMEFHPVASIFPLMEGSEFESLKTDIQENGLVEDIWVYEEKIIDGRNRYNACVELGIEPRYKEWEDNGNLLTFVISLNLKRRHLQESQRALIAGEIANMEGGERTDLVKNVTEPSANLHKVDKPKSTKKKTRKKIKSDEAKVSRSDAANLLNVSVRSVASAKKVLEKGTSEIKHLVNVGELKVGTAEKIVKLSKEDQKNIAKKIDKGAKPAEAIKQVEIENRTKDIVLVEENLHIGDFREVGKTIPDNSVDIVFTDPPYAKEHLPLFEDLSILAERILKPGGLLLSYSGQFYLPTVIEKLSKNLEYVWVFGIEHTGKKPSKPERGIINCWKPIFCYCKPPKTVLWKRVPDMIKGTMEKDSHEWQQGLSEAIYYISKLCVIENALIVDPMCGSGTVLLAAKQLGHRYIGIDKEERNVLETNRRLSENDKTNELES